MPYGIGLQDGPDIIEFHQEQIEQAVGLRHSGGSAAGVERLKIVNVGALLAIQSENPQQVSQHVWEWGPHGLISNTYNGVAPGVGWQ